MNKQSALEIILEFYDAPPEDLEYVYNLTIDIYSEVTRSNLISALKEYYKQRIESNDLMLNVFNQNPDFLVQISEINRQNKLLTEQINNLEYYNIK